MDLKRLLAAASSAASIEETRSLVARAIDAARDWAGESYVALQAPVAWRTWEAQTQLTSAAPESPSAALEYPHPVEIVGLLPVIVPLRPQLPQPGLVVPTLDDVLVSVQWDQEQTATAGQDQTAQTGRSSFVTASSLSIIPARLWKIEIVSPKPVVTFSWRWKQGPNVFVDSLCSVATFVRPLRPYKGAV